MVHLNWLFACSTPAATRKACHLVPHPLSPLSMISDHNTGTVGGNGTLTLALTARLELTLCTCHCAALAYSATRRESFVRQQKFE